MSMYFPPEPPKPTYNFPYPTWQAAFHASAHLTTMRYTMTNEELGTAMRTHRGFHYLMGVVAQLRDEWVAMLQATCDHSNHSANDVRWSDTEGEDGDENGDGRWTGGDGMLRTAGSSTSKGKDGKKSSISRRPHKLSTSAELNFMKGEKVLIVIIIVSGCIVITNVFASARGSPQDLRESKKVLLLVKEASEEAVKETLKGYRVGFWRGLRAVVTLGIWG